jgi:hypothetical protein
VLGVSEQCGGMNASASAALVAGYYLVAKDAENSAGHPQREMRGAPMVDQFAVALHPGEDG